MSKRKLIARIALIICDIACMSVMIYMVYLIGKQEVISFNNFLLLLGGLLWFTIWVLAIADLLIRGKDSILAKSFKQAFNIVFNKLLRTDLKLD